MYIMTLADRRLLDTYKAIGTPEEIKARLASSYPTTDDYAPLPLADDECFCFAHGLLDDEGPPIVDDPWAENDAPYGCNCKTPRGKVTITTKNIL